MNLKKSVVIKSKFGTKTAGNYLLRYSTREDATESLEINDYITKYTPRYEATEQLLSEGAEANDILKEDEKLIRKEGVMFGNRGLSYSDQTLKEAARITQKASDEGHVVLLPIISFEHSYLVEKGLVDKDMPEPENRGDYKGKVDQLKLRMAITDMVNKMHFDMGFDKPEWTATIQFDTKHVHAHITSVETGTPKDKRMKEVFKDNGNYRPSMEWHTKDQTTPYEIEEEDEFLVYKRNDEVVATQRATTKGNPKWFKTNTKSIEKERVETGVINDKVKARMRDTLNRSLSKTKDIKPFVKEITDKRQLTKNLTVKSLSYDDVTVKKLQSLTMALPENKKMWRAGSNAKAMERPHQIANEIIDDMWTRYREGVYLGDFEESVNQYIDTRQFDEKFDDDKRNDLYKEAFNRLRTESINALYKTIKEQVKEADQEYKVPVQSIQSLTTEQLQNEISAGYHNLSDGKYSDVVQFEYRNRSYKERYLDAKFKAKDYKDNLENYDELDRLNKTSEESKVVREHYQKEYEYYSGVEDKYTYIHNKRDDKAKERFDEVKGVDLINMLYDYGKNDDRSIPREIAFKYYNQTNARKEAVNNTLDYLIETGQYEQYELMQTHRDAIRKEAEIADQIYSELKIPVPGKPENYKPIEERKTIDTIQGRRLLKQEIKEVQNVTHEFKHKYEWNGNLKKEIDNKPDKNIDIDYVKQFNNKRNEWNVNKQEFKRYLYEQEQKELNEEILKQAMLYDENKPFEANINITKEEELEL